MRSGHFLYTFVFCLTAPLAQAETLYITDTTQAELLSAPKRQAKTIKPLPAGTALTLVDDHHIAKSYRHVRLDDGTEGYLLGRYVTQTPPDPPTLTKPTAYLSPKALETENQALKVELQLLKNPLEPGTALEKSLTAERNRLSLELAELKQAVNPVVPLKEERDALQTRAINAEQKLQQLELENAALKNTRNQDWFVYGGLITLLGVILGAVLAKWGGQRRRNHWDW